MRIEFTDKNLAPASIESLHLYAEKKINKFDRYFKKEPESRVVMRVDRERHGCEITIHADGTYFRASVETTDMYASVDACIASIVRQIHKYRTKLDKRLHVKAFETGGDFDPSPADDSEFNVIRRKTFNLKPMTPEEAILQMQLLSHTFYVFRDSENRGAFSVVYCRKNGGYGLISEG